MTLPPRCTTSFRDGVAVVTVLALHEEEGGDVLLARVEGADAALATDAVQARYGGYPARVEVHATFRLADAVRAELLARGVAVVEAAD
jgi:hypothetical protein